ncbi:MAG TPA: glycosyltransferase family 2 protein, partial [Acidimicrobiales bacterium]|nr:glycosyltransferase family 2 protein [Acidimicrobiales bacterium]
IIAENGSTDRTGEEMSLLASTYPEVSMLRLPEANYGAALRAGFLAATGDIVVNFDVDFVDLAFVAEAIRHIDAEDAAMVVGSKRAPGSVDRRGAVRRAVTAVFSLILRYGFSLRVSDTHGMKAMRRERVEPFVRASRLGQDVFDTEVVLRLERAGLPVVEIPVTVEELRPARTPIWLRIPRSLFRLFQLRIQLWREKPDSAGGAQRTID